MQRSCGSCSNAPLCLRRRLDKSDRIGTKMRHVFHCAAEASSNILGTAVSIAFHWSIASKLFRQSSFVRKIATAVPKTSDDNTAAQ